MKTSHLSYLFFLLCTVLLLVFLLALVAPGAFAATYIPETSERTIQEMPLDRGEVAFLATDDGRARLVIGGPGGETLRVKDEATLHGFRYEYIPRTEVTVIAGEGISYNSGLDTWTVPAAVGTYTITVQCASGIEIESLEYAEVACYVDMIEIPNGEITYTINGNVATITMERRDARGTMSVARIRIRRVLNGRVDDVTDLTTLHMPVVDSIGETELGEFRYWAERRWEGNRGEDWSRYPAKSRATMAGHELILSKTRRFGLTGTPTQTVFRAANHDALVIKATGSGRGYWGAFDVARVVQTATGADLLIEHDIDGFNPSLIEVKGGATLNTNSWQTLSYSYTAADSTLHVVNSGNVYFYRVFYNGEPVDECSIDFNVPVYIRDALYLKGSDSHIYRITVSGGTLSATAVD